MSMIYYKQALYMKKWLKGLILLTFLPSHSLKGLFLRHEEHSESHFYNIYRCFSSFLQPQIRLSSRFCTIAGHQKR